MTPAPSMIKSTPPQRSSETSSCKINFAAIVVSTKPSDVSGQMKLTVPLDIKTSSVPKKIASNKTPSRILWFDTPALMMRLISPALIDFALRQPVSNRG